MAGRWEILLGFSEWPKGISDLGHTVESRGVRSDQGATLVPGGTRLVRMLKFGLRAPVAQLDRVPGYEPGGREFESLQARHPSQNKERVSLLRSAR